MRIRTRAEFAHSRKHGRAFPGRFLVLSLAPDPAADSPLPAARAPDAPPPFRFGIIITRKVGNAVTRNLVRRRLKSLLSRHGEHVAPGHLLVLIARHTAPGATFADLERDWLRLLRRAGVWQGGPRR